MANPTNSYVDPSIAADTGAGTVGDPAGDLQGWLDRMTRDSSNGDRINIKAGTSEILSGALSLATYGSPGAGKPLILQGYTAAAMDGGIGSLDFNSGIFTLLAATPFVHFYDLKFHNASPTTYAVNIGAVQVIKGCHFTDITGSALTVGYASVIGNRFDDISGAGVTVPSTSPVNIIFNDFRNGTKAFTYAITTPSSPVLTVARNTISLDGASVGINVGYYVTVMNNSILSSAGTGTGILQFGAHTGCRIINNLVEGFSGAGGRGFHLSSGPQTLFRNNAAFNNTTSYSSLGADYDSDDNESLGSSPFDKSGADTYANRFTYLAPSTVGNVRTGYPSGSNIVKGAVQPAAIAAGGGRLVNGGLVG